MIQDRTSVFPKAFTELTLGLRCIEGGTFCILICQVYEIFGVARYGVGDFFSFVSCKKKYSLLDPLGEKNR